MKRAGSALAILLAAVIVFVLVQGVPLEYILAVGAVAYGIGFVVRYRRRARTKYPD